MRGAERNTLLTVQHSPSACSPSRSICVGASRVWESQGNGSGSRSGVLAGIIAYEILGSNLRNRAVVSSRSKTLAATASVSSSHSGASD